MSGGIRAAATRLTARRRTRPRRWSVNIAAPATRVGDLWGDVHFAEALAAALRRRGEEVAVRRHGAHDPADRAGCDVSLTLRGLDRVAPRPGAVNVLWVISHPDLVTDGELAEHEIVAASSPPWAARAAARLGRPVHALLQATEADRFRPDDDPGPPAAGHDVLFVGVRPAARERPVVPAALAAGAQLAVYGRGWRDRLPTGVFRGDDLPNTRLPEAYRRAGVVLNDHWPDMAAHGFLNNRLFDAVACGACVVSDRVTGIETLFGGAVQVFDDPADLRRLLGPQRALAFPAPAARRAVAERIRAEHSFDARAAQLVELVRARASSPRRLAAGRPAAAPPGPRAGRR